MTKKRRYVLDNSALMHLAIATARKSNTFRITVTMAQPVDPELLQQAVDDITPRFPTIMASIRKGFFQHYVVPLEKGPRVRRDGRSLECMTYKEIKECAVRVGWNGNRISFECFHSLTDGYGGFALIRALLAQYLKLGYGVEFENDPLVLTPGQPVTREETEDSFLRHTGEKGSAFPGVLSYLPGEEQPHDALHSTVADFETGHILSVARSYGVSITALLTAVMMRSVMQMQLQKRRGRLRPVQIMVPANLRKRFHSGTLRNFSLYALPGMKPEDIHIPFGDFVRKVGHQLERQFDPARLRAMITTNVRLQNHTPFRWIPLGLKCLILRIGYHFFGGRTSALTLTNLGETALPEGMKSYIQNVDVTMSPRPSSPYNCAVLSFNGRLRICFSRWCEKSELEPVFLANLKALGCVPAATEFGM